jgi:hypothetical protein
LKAAKREFIAASEDIDGSERELCWKRRCFRATGEVELVEVSRSYRSEPVPFVVRPDASSACGHKRNRGNPAR